MNKDLRKKSIAELQTMLLEKTKASRDFTLGLSKTKSKNVREGRNTKKEIAHIMTLINEMKANA